MSPYRDPIAIHGVGFPRLLPPESDIYLDLVSGFRYLEHRLLYIRINRERWLDRKRYRNRWVILAFLVVYISSDFSSFLLQALDTVVILSIGVVSSDHSHSRLISWLNCFFSFSFCTVFELFTLFTLFFFFFLFFFLYFYYTRKIVLHHHLVNTSMVFPLDIFRKSSPVTSKNSSMHSVQEPAGVMYAIRRWQTWHLVALATPAFLHIE